MVTSEVSEPTYRIGVLLDSILKPVAAQYCEGELVKDTADFLGKLENNWAAGNQKAGVENLVATDVCALYPNIKIEWALVAVRDALQTASDYDETAVTWILDLLELYTLKHSVVQYKSDWFLSIGGQEDPKSFGHF